MRDWLGAGPTGGPGVAAWNAASGYIRGIALVAFIDTTVITLGMLGIGTPHAGTLALPSFVSLFIPIPRRVGLGHRPRARHARRAPHRTRRRDGGRDPDRPAARQLFVTPLVYQQTVNLHRSSR